MKSIWTIGSLLWLVGSCNFPVNLYRKLTGDTANCPQSSPSLSAIKSEDKFYSAFDYQICNLEADSDTMNAQYVEQIRGEKEEELIRAAWLGLNKSEMTWQEKLAECGTALTEQGLRSLYCDVKPFIDYRKLQIVSGLPIFRSGPHSRIKLNIYAPYRFGYYNPKFLKWLQKNIIPAEQDGSFKQQTQPIYEQKIRTTAKAFYATYQILLANSEKFEAIKHEYIEHLKNNTLPEIYLQEKFRWLSDYLATEGKYDWYAANTAGGFWVRRSIDGTDKEFFQLLRKLLKTYDQDWLHEQELLKVFN